MAKLDPFSSLRKSIEATHSFANEEFEQLTTYLSVRTLKKKEFFNTQNQYCRYVGFVNSGCLRGFHVDQKGDEFTIFFALAGLWAGDKTSFYSRRPSMFNIQALEESEVVYVDKDTWEQALEAVPTFEKWYRARSRKTVEEAQRKLIEWQTQSAEEKYLNLLNENPAIVERIPQHYIASYFGIKPQSLSRIRKKYLRS